MAQSHLGNFKNACLVINPSSGSASDISDDAKSIFKSYDLDLPHILIDHDNDILAVFEDLKRISPDLLITFGGDGTANLGAKYAIEHDIPFVPLPGGTMNLFPKDVYGSDNWEECLHMAITQKTTQNYAFGRVKEHIFLVGAFIGDPVELQKTREKARKGELGAGLEDAAKAWRSAQQSPQITFQTPDQEDVSKSVLLLVSIQRHQTRSKSFEISSLSPIEMKELIGLGWNALISDWRDHPAINVHDSDRLYITEPKTIPLLLDGERFDLAAPLDISCDHDRLKLLCPPVTSTPANIEKE